MFPIKNQTMKSHMLIKILGGDEILFLPTVNFWFRKYNLLRNLYS